MSCSQCKHSWQCQQRPPPFTKDFFNDDNVIMTEGFFRRMVNYGCTYFENLHLNQDILMTSVTMRYDPRDTVRYELARGQLSAMFRVSDDYRGALVSLLMGKHLAFVANYSYEWKTLCVFPRVLSDIVANPTASYLPDGTINISQHTPLAGFSIWKVDFLIRIPVPYWEQPTG